MFVRLMGLLFDWCLSSTRSRVIIWKDILRGEVIGVSDARKLSNLVLDAIVDILPFGWCSELTWIFHPRLPSLLSVGRIKGDRGL